MLTVPSYSYILSQLHINNVQTLCYEFIDKVLNMSLRFYEEDLLI